MLLHVKFENAHENGFLREDYDEVYDFYYRTYIRKRQFEPSFEDIKKLRKEICLNSIYYDDYRNTLMIDEWEVCAFFDGYLEHLGEVVEERVGEQLANGISDDAWLNMMFDLDSDEELEYWYLDWLACENTFTQYYYVEECDGVDEEVA